MLKKEKFASPNQTERSAGKNRDVRLDSAIPVHKSSRSSWTAVSSLPFELLDTVSRTAGPTL